MKVARTEVSSTTVVYRNVYRNCLPRTFAEKSTFLGWVDTHHGIEKVDSIEVAEEAVEGVEDDDDEICDMEDFEDDDDLVIRKLCFRKSPLWKFVNIFSCEQSCLISGLLTVWLQKRSNLT